MISDILDPALAIAQGVMAMLLWHRAEPRLRAARGWQQGWCVIFLGFVMAWSVPLAFIRPDVESVWDWQRSVRDVALLCAALCFYRHAMTVEPREPAKVRR